MSDKSTRKAPDYAVESRAARNRSVFDRNCSMGLARPIRSGTIQANRCRKRRFLLMRCPHCHSRLSATCMVAFSFHAATARSG